ncbi:MAG: TIM barrel protein [Clostridia bacterium]|nr:TIM barrel protein [Clostridia bacterium]
MPVRIGVCAPLEQILLLEGMGYDYIEGNLSQTAIMDNHAFRTLCAVVDQSQIKAEVMGYMLPREISVTGRGVNAQLLHSYLDLAFRRAKRLGCRVIAFASAGSRQVPEDWPFDRAWRQMTNFFRIVERHAQEHDLLVCVEPLNRGECNILHTVSEATLLCSLLQLDHIRVLANTYHMAMEHEPLDSLACAGALLGHVHTANALGRLFPKIGDGEDYKALFRTLDRIGYTGRVSVEAAWNDFREDAQDAFFCLDSSRHFLGTPSD